MSGSGKSEIMRALVASSPSFNLVSRNSIVRKLLIRLLGFSEKLTNKKIIYHRFASSRVRIFMNNLYSSNELRHQIVSDSGELVFDEFIKFITNIVVKIVQVKGSRSRRIALIDEGIFQNIDIGIISGMKSQHIENVLPDLVVVYSPSLKTVKQRVQMRVRKSGYLNFVHREPSEEDLAYLLRKFEANLPYIRDFCKRNDIRLINYDDSIGIPLLSEMIYAQLNKGM